MQVQLVAQNHPGILDGIVPMCSYPDITTIITPVVDCALIDRAMDEGSQDWSLEQVSAVTGYADNGSIETCTLWNLFFSPDWIVPAPCPSVIPAELVYDPDANPDGVRCTIHDNTVNAFGTDPQTGFARRPVDNVGVQYGLQAFNDGAIDYDQFAELNELAGGYDVDGNLVEQRTVGDAEALRIAYETGRVNTGAGGLADIPIIDVRGYTDTNVDIHDRFRSFSTRERLIAANGHADNHIIWIADGSTFIVGAPHNTEAVLLIDQWLAAIRSDNAAGSASEKVVRNKPDAAVDTCWTPTGERIVEPATVDGPGTCNTHYPSHADPRVVAGSAVANDVLKCQLMPVETAVAENFYGSALSADEVARLQEIFSDGVCDYDLPSVGDPAADDLARAPRALSFGSFVIVFAERGTAVELRSAGEVVDSKKAQRGVTIFARVGEGTYVVRSVDDGQPGHRSAPFDVH
jgi:hypothetical protein